MVATAPIAMIANPGTKKRSRPIPCSWRTLRSLWVKIVRACAQSSHAPGPPTNGRVTRQMAATISTPPTNSLNRRSRRSQSVAIALYGLNSGASTSPIPKVGPSANKPSAAIATLPLMIPSRIGGQNSRAIDQPHDSPSRRRPATSRATEPAMNRNPPMLPGRVASSANRAIVGGE